jgi:protein-tyrosine-phosphatase
VTPEPPLRVLFVCTANICRSAYAELLTRHLLGDEASVLASSAGTHGYVEHPLDPPMAAELARRGGDAGGFRSRVLTMPMVDEADLVLTAEVAHRKFILDERPEAFRRVLTVGQLGRTLRESTTLDGTAGRELLRGLRRSFRPADAADDVPDPYRRGEAAAARAADQLERHLREILPRLAGRNAL